MPSTFAMWSGQRRCSGAIARCAHTYWWRSMNTPSNMGTTPFRNGRMSPTTPSPIRPKPADLRRQDGRSSTMAMQMDPP